MKQLVLDIARPPEPTLDNFVAGQNVELLAQLRELLQAGPRERFVYVWGPQGAGRSHLLRAFAAARAGAVYLPQSRHAELGQGLSEGDAVAVDDVELLDETAQIGLFNLYNRLREEDGMLLAAGSCAPAQLKLRPDVVTRLGWGLVYQVHPLSDTEKASALRGHAAARGFALADEVANYLLRHWRRDLPSLMAVLDALDAYSLETKRPITVPMVRELMQASLDLQ